MKFVKLSRISLLGLILMIPGIAIAAGPNLTITAITRLPSSPVVNEQVTFQAYIKNIGDQSVALSEARIRLDFNADGSFETILNQTVIPLAVGQTEAVSFLWTPLAAGTYKSEICADSTNSISETNESDNCVLQTFTAENATGGSGTGGGGTTAPAAASKPASGGGGGSSTPAPTPRNGVDLETTTILFSPTQPVKYQQNTITALIRNNGTYNGPITQTRLRIDAGNDGTFDQTLTQRTPAINSLASGEVNFYWTPNTSGDQRIEVCADAENSTSEYDEGNNCLTNTFGLVQDSYVLIPTVSISLEPAQIGPGENASLSWNSSKANFCEASGAWTGNVGASGSRIVSPTKENNIYRLTCFNDYGQNSAQLNAIIDNLVSNKPIVSLNVVLDNLSFGESTALLWSVTEADSCQASNGWTGPKNSSGSEIITPQTTTPYTLTCSNKYGSTSVTKNVAVGPARNPLELKAGCAVEPDSIAIGKNTNFAAAASGGTGPYIFKWTGDVRGTGLLKTVSFKTPGIKIADVTAIDAKGQTASASCKVRVEQPTAKPITAISSRPQILTVIATATSTIIATSSLPTEPEVIESVAPEEVSQGAGTGFFAAIGLSGLGWNCKTLNLLLFLILLVIVLNYIYKKYYRPRRQRGIRKPPTIPPYPSLPPINF